MNYYMSNDIITKHTGIWVQNFSLDAKIRRDIPIIKSISTIGRLPWKTDILARYHTLLAHTKDKKVKMGMVTDELICLWEKFSFPNLSKQAIMSKLQKLIASYEKNQRLPKDIFNIEIQNVFDISQKCGMWLCNEDKELYKV